MRPRTLFALLFTVFTLALPQLARAQADGVTITATPQFTTVTPGQNMAIALTFEFTNHLHIWPHEPILPEGLDDLKLIPTTATLAKGTLPPGVKVLTDNGQWPRGTPLKTGALGGEVTAIVYHDRTVAYIPVAIDATANPGKVTVLLTISYQACNESSCFPQEDVETPVTFEIGPVLIPADAALFTGFNAATAFNPAGTAAPAVPAPQPAAGPTVIDLGIGGLKLTINGVFSYVLLMLLAILGGLVLNLTPCVLPVIPLKILGLQSQAGSRSRMLFLGFVMFCGLVFFWLVTGGLIAFGVLSAVSRISSFWQFNLAIAVFMAVMGMGMFGLFTVGLPNWVYAIDAKHDSAKGSFLFGIMSAVLATPCVAPLAGGVMAAATLFPRPVALLIFLFIGVGMGLPYLVLAAYPRLVAWLPRAGPGSELLKQVLGMLMIVISLFFLGSALITLAVSKPWIARQLHWWAIAIGLAITALWLIARTWQITRSPVRRTAFTLVALFLSTAGFLWANTQTNIARRTSLLWKDYTPEAVDAALRQGDVVVLDFTAEWCINCKTLEATVLAAAKVEDELLKARTFRVDCTAADAPGWKRLADLGQKGVPTLVILGPGFKQPWVRNIYTPDEVVNAIRLAGTKSTSAASR